MMAIGVGYRHWKHRWCRSADTVSPCVTGADWHPIHQCRLPVLSRVWFARLASI